MKTTCICCGRRAQHESVRRLGGTWYRCHSCNFAWRGVRGYLCSVVANVWWPIKGPTRLGGGSPLVTPPTSRSSTFPDSGRTPDDPSGGPGSGGPKLRQMTGSAGRTTGEGPVGGSGRTQARIVWDGPHRRPVDPGDEHAA